MGLCRFAIVVCVALFIAACRASGLPSLHRQITRVRSDWLPLSPKTRSTLAVLSSTPHLLLAIGKLQRAIEWYRLPLRIHSLSHHFRLTPQPAGSLPSPRPPPPPRNHSSPHHHRATYNIRNGLSWFAADGSAYPERVPEEPCRFRQHHQPD